MQLNELFTIITFPACMAHVLPAQSYIPNLLVVFQLVFHNDDSLIRAYQYLVAHARSHVGAPLMFYFRFCVNCTVMSVIVLFVSSECPVRNPHISYHSFLECEHFRGRTPFLWGGLFQLHSPSPHAAMMKLNSSSNSAYCTWVNTDKVIAAFGGTPMIL